jgi:hypothetical protein
MSAAIDRQRPQLACIASDVRLGERVGISPYVNLYGCIVGDDTRLGAFVEVFSTTQSLASVARSRVTPSSAPG